VIQVALDTASDLAGVALTEGEALIAELTWRTHQNHSRQLLPSLQMLLERSSLTKDDIDAVFVCLGPGSYAGLRVGVSTAKALAFGLGVPVAGVGRLAADAYSLATDGGPRVIAVHAAGRAELAWAAYARRGPSLYEVLGTRLGSREALLDIISRGDIVCGELDEALGSGVRSRGAVMAEPSPSRVVAVARLGQARLRAGNIDSTDSLVPLYLREPAIGPQPPR
jgi:tRNA threonylcarbamoyladenosine biosynthesis protein TsaB